MNFKNWSILGKSIFVGGLIMVIQLFALLLRFGFRIQSSLFYDIIPGYIITFLSMAISLWLCNLVSIKLISRNYGALSFILGLVSLPVTFFILYMVVPSPLIDNRGGWGILRYISLESISHMFRGVLFLILTIILGIVILVSNLNKKVEKI